MVEVKKLDSKVPEVRTATIRILSAVILGPGVDAEKGEIWEVPRHMANLLVGHGQAEIVDVKDDPEEYGVRIETPTTRDPRPKRKS